MTGEPTVTERPALRRDRLLDWLAEKPEHEGLTTSQIHSLSGIYDWLGRETAHRDLRALERAGAVVNVNLFGPAQWRPILWSEEAPDGE